MKKLLCLATALASLVAFQPGQAKADGLFDFLFRGDPKVAASGIIVGGAMTGTYYAIAPHRHHTHRYGLTRAGAAGLTTIGCMVLGPMVAAAWVDATEHRELTQREALGLAGDCVIPFLGSLYWNAYFDAHPELEKGRRHRHRHK